MYLDKIHLIIFTDFRAASDQSFELAFVLRMLSHYNERRGGH